MNCYSFYADKQDFFSKLIQMGDIDTDTPIRAVITCMRIPELYHQSDGACKCLDCVSGI